MVQKNKKGLGAAVEILSYTFAWFSIINTGLIILLAYDKVKSLLVSYLTFTDWSWFSYPVFFLLALLPVIIMYILEWFVIYPARQRFRNLQEQASGSPIIDELAKRPTKEEIREIIKEELNEH